MVIYPGQTVCQRYQKNQRPWVLPREFITADSTLQISGRSPWVGLAGIHQQAWICPAQLQDESAIVAHSHDYTASW